MNTFDSTSASDILKNYRPQNERDDGSNRASDLGRNEFMELMLAQLNNQNPLQPQEDGDFIAQLAQFSSLEEMQKLTGTVQDVAGQFRSTQALQASAMVGQSVMVESDIAELGPEGEVRGAVNLPGSTSNLSLSIFNPGGDLGRRIEMGPQSAGEKSFTWDGENNSGELMPPGDYRIKAEASFDGENEQLATQLSANVDSVSLEDGGKVTLNLAGRGSVPLSDVRRVN